jgi:hypothetical protein
VKPLVTHSCPLLGSSCSSRHAARSRCQQHNSSIWRSGQPAMGQHHPPSSSSSSSSNHDRSTLSSSSTAYACSSSSCSTAGSGYGAVCGPCQQRTRHSGAAQDGPGGWGGVGWRVGRVQQTKASAPATAVASGLMLTAVCWRWAGCCGAKGVALLQPCPDPAAALADVHHANCSG